MATPMLPRAERRYISKKKPSHLDETTALHALAVTGGAGYVILGRYGPSGKQRAARVARAWNQMVSAAESRHESFWARHGREAAG
jgi:hypothetical protein